MLERVLVIAYIIVVVIRISKEVIVLCKDICRTQVWRREQSRFRCLQLKYLFGIVRQVFSKLITQVGVSVLVTNNLDRVIHTYATMIGSNDDFGIRTSNLLE